jgi:hypothetical protein
MGNYDHTYRNSSVQHYLSNDIDCGHQLLVMESNPEAETPPATHTSYKKARQYLGED